MGSEVGNKASEVRKYVRVIGRLHTELQKLGHGLCRGVYDLTLKALQTCYVSNIRCLQILDRITSSSSKYIPQGKFECRNSDGRRILSLE